MTGLDLLLILTVFSVLEHAALPWLKRLVSHTTTKLDDRVLTAVEALGDISQHLLMADELAPDQRARLLELVSKAGQHCWRVHSQHQDD